MRCARRLLLGALLPALAVAAQPPATDAEATRLEAQVSRDVEPEPLALLGASVAPGQLQRIRWSVELTVRHEIPVLVAHGRHRGPAICLTAALHGDELNGIEIARQVVAELDTKALAGTVISVPIVNMEGFLKQSRYIADRRDLNRFFPGDPRGVTPARFAHLLFDNVIRHCDGLVDLHTGSYFRTNLPQLRADMTNEAVVGMVRKFGEMTVLHSPGKPGMLRNAAVAAGIPSVTMEVGGPLSVNQEAVEFGVHAVRTLLGELGMTERLPFEASAQPVFYHSEWMLAEDSGILLAEVRLGDEVRKGHLLARIVDPITYTTEEVISHYDGAVLGMALNQFVSPGYLLFRIGIERSEAELRDEAQRGETDADAALDVLVDAEEKVPERAAPPDAPPAR